MTTTTQPTLLVFNSIKLGGGYVADLTSYVRDWRRTIRLQGGYWIGNMTIVRPLSELIEMFYEWLGYHVEERVGGAVTWEGMIYEMTLNTGFTARTRSLNDMYNYVTTTYMGNNKVQTSSAAQVVNSINRYGRRETLLSYDQLDSTSAIKLRDRYLSEHAWPWPRPAYSQPGEASLEIIVCGYIFTANWRYTTTADGKSSTVQDWIKSIVETDLSEFLVNRWVAPNSLAIQRSLQTPTRCWDQILNLVSLGDPDSRLYRALVKSGREFHYGPVDLTPLYYIVKGQLVTGVGSTMQAVHPCSVQPGVYRDMDWPQARSEPGSALYDGRDMLIEEISYGINSGLSWQVSEHSEVGILAQQAEYRTAQTNTQASVAPGTQGVEWWKRWVKATGGTKEQWASLPLSERWKWKKQWWAKKKR